MLQRSLLALLLGLTALPLAARQAATPPQASPAAANHPITRQQLQTYFDESLLLEGSRQHIREGLAKDRAKLPPWFPENVWQDVRQQIDAIDWVQVLLPLYQRHFTERDGAILVLLYQGPTGHAYAEASLASRKQAVSEGYEGSAAEIHARSSPNEARATLLARQRIAEFTPEERSGFEALGVHRKAIPGDGLALDDEQNRIMSARGNEVFQHVLAAHSRELALAQASYHPPPATP